MRVAVSGAGGRLGRALVAALEDAPFTGLGGPIAWTRAEFDLDDANPATFERRLDRDHPEVVVHAAAWTDVDGCARDPDAALRRNGRATGDLAAACVARGIDLVLVSTNEVFDGERTDGRGYGPDDPPNPINPYGASKLAGERLATDAFVAAGCPAPRGYDPVHALRRPGLPQLAIVRTAWLFGPPGDDFPAKILRAAATAIAAGEPLRVVADEVGTPTLTTDLAEAIVELLADGAFAGIHHLVNGGTASRAAWARDVLRLAGVPAPITEIPSSAWTRASTPPRWAVLEPTPLPSGEPLRPWPAALADRMATRA